MGKKANKKQFYKNMQQKSQRASMIQDGLKGFFLTCKTGTEKRWIKEIFNVLNEYTEKLYPDLEAQRKINDEKKRKQKEELDKAKEAEANKTEIKEENTNQNIKEENNQPEVSMTEPKHNNEDNKEVKQEEEKKEQTLDQLIAQEIQEIKKEQVFYVFDLRMSSLIFIKISDPYKDIIDVKKLGNAVIKDVMEEGKTVTRFWLRFLPILFVWKASNFGTFKTLAEKEINEYFKKTDGVKWSLEYKNRGNKTIKREDILDFVYNLINTTGSGNSVDLSNPEHSVIVEVCMDVVLFTIVPKFKEYRKYNISSLDTQQQPKDPQKTSQPKEENKDSQDVNETQNLTENKPEEKATTNPQVQPQKDVVKASEAKPKNEDGDSSDGDIDII